MSKRFDISDIKRTLRYMKRNGIHDTYYTARERLEMRSKEHYSYTYPEDSVLAAQRKETACDDDLPRITIVIPAYNTPARYLREAVESVASQSYPHWRLIVCDASDGIESDGSVPRDPVAAQGSDIPVNANADTETDIDIETVSSVMKGYLSDTRIVYMRLDSNGGISANANAGIERALSELSSGDGISGDYIGILDHDDVLAPDALYHMAKAAIKYKLESDSDAIPASKHMDTLPIMLYSDEDKIEDASNTGVHEIGAADTDARLAETLPRGRAYFAPHRKYDFNYDLLLANNYICHLMLVRSDILEEIRFKSEYDGAQDYDLALQIVRYLRVKRGVRTVDLDKYIVHVPRILYHWRSHMGSTATNTESKTYAYEAGLAALKEHMRLMYEEEDGAHITVTHSKHLGFYDINYERARNASQYDCLYKLRPDIGAVIGRVLDGHGRMSECIYDADGHPLYAGLNKNYAGEFNRFDCAQDVYMADIRYVDVRPELRHVLEKAGGDSEAFASRLREMGYLILYDAKHYSSDT